MRVRISHPALKIRNREKQIGYQRKHYLANKAKVIADIQERKKERIEYIRFLKSVPCSDCGKEYPWWIMQFDHVRGKKLNNLSEMSYNGVDKINEEALKCDVVCANCHADRTHKRIEK